MLLIEADDDLRLDRAVSQAGDNRLLYFRQGPSRGRNLTRIGHIDAALLVDGLRREIDKIARTRACGRGRRKQAARGGLENRNVEHVADTGDLLWLGTLVRKLALERHQIGLRQ